MNRLLAAIIFSKKKILSRSTGYRAYLQLHTFFCDHSFSNMDEDLSKRDIFDGIKEVYPTNLAQHVEWDWTEMKANADFNLSKVLTEFGQCMVFNGISRHEMYTNE